MGDFTVIFYSTTDGREPARDFLDSLDLKMKAKMVKTIAFLQDVGTAAREPYSEYIDDGIFELRAKVGSDISRIMYFFYAGGKIILTNGFIKKTQKAPKNEIYLAKKYREDYLKRAMKGELDND